MKKLGILSVLACAVLVAQADDVNVLEGVSVNGENSYVSRDDIELSSPTNLYRIEKSAQFGTEVITQKEIEAYKPKDVFDLLNKATGLDLTYQGRKSPFFINMRGGGSITYIVDGAILPSTSNRILQKIPMIAIEEIQIVRSSTALSLAPTIGIGASNSGSGVNIGFVIIRTKQPKETQGLISAFYEQAVNQPGANGQSIYAGTDFGDIHGVNGYIGGMISRFDRPSKDEWFDGSDAQSGMINGGLNYGGFTLNLMGYKDSGRFEMQRGVKTDGTIDTAKWYYDPIDTTILSVDASMAWSENQITLFSASKTDYEQEEHNENFANSSVAVKNYEEKTQTYSLRHNARFGNTFVQLGGQLTNSKGFGPNLSNSFNKFDTTVRGYALSVEQTLLSGDLVLDAGYRQDQKHIDNSVAAKNQTQFNANLDANNDVWLSPANVFAFGALYNIDDTHKINARYMRANEGSGADFDLVAENNATLHEEEQTRYEIGIEAQYDKAFKPMVTYFDVHMKNQKSATTKTYNDTDGNEYYYYTESDSHKKGLELSINGVIAGATRYKFSWTRMLANETINSNATTDSIGISSPRNIYSALISHTWEEYLFNLSAKKADPYSSSTSAMGVSTDVSLGDYTRIDANVARNFKWDGVATTVKLYGRNLTNDQYATRYTTGYYYDRGRTLGAEVSFAF